MHLIDDPWIPIRRASGKTELIRPAQIAESDDPVVALTSCRPDFNGALTQFLIGLLQTAFALRNDDEWEQYLEKPPSMEALQEAFAKVSHAFQLNGDGPRFMQDFDPLENRLNDSQLKNATKPIGALLIDAPGDQTLRNNADHFIKRGHAEALCPACAATALFTLQTNAPSGGAGHRTSIRGGGPLTTLVILDPEGGQLSSTLWRDLWLNILPKATKLTGNPELTKPHHTFPWLAPTRTSDKKGQDTTPEDASPLQMYWAMPRRVRLDFDATDSGPCDLCGMESDNRLHRYVTLNYGTNYTGAWRHPLSPYQERRDTEPLPLHPQPGGISYRLWSDLIYNQPEGNQGISPAIVVREFMRNKLDEEQLRLWTFGYDMDNMKPRCWYETTLPLYLVPNEIRTEFSGRVEQLIKGAEYVADLLRRQIKQAWFKRPGDIRGDVSFLADGFYQHTEGNFYTCARDLIQAIPEDTDYDILARWHRIVVKAAFDMFDEWTTAGDIAFSDPRRIAQARESLRKGLYAKKLTRQILPIQKEKAA
ncbi:MAG: type I-E CRISPR-associated protein Cse1/CasA [Methylothermaceae bacterium]|nr:type I-E CRISPR-associated protein Cse1/CasA [Methylothermaceae bacterium]